MTFGIGEITEDLSEAVSVRRPEEGVSLAKGIATAKALRWEQMW